MAADIIDILQTIELQNIEEQTRRNLDRLAITMEILSMKRLLVFLVISASVVTQAASSFAIAQTSTPAATSDNSASGSACGSAPNLPDKVPAAQLSGFKSDPNSLLKSNPIGGLQLSGEVKGLTVTDPNAAVDALLDVARSANSAQAAAIGTGLGQAVKAILGVNKACGDEIARKIAGSALSDLLTGYNMAMADTPLLLAGGGDAGGGGLGGVVNGTSGSSAGATTSASGSTSRTNTAETASFSGSTITCSTSVSPRKKC